MTMTTKKTNTNDFTAKWWTAELKGIQFRDEGDLWQITKVSSTAGGRLIILTRKQKQSNKKLLERCWKLV